MIWSEIKQLWDVGLKEYVSDLWNVVDFITNSLYVATIGLRLRAYYDVSPIMFFGDRIVSSVRLSFMSGCFYQAGRAEQNIPSCVFCPASEKT